MTWWEWALIGLGSAVVIVASLIVGVLIRFGHRMSTRGPF